MTTVIDESNKQYLGWKFVLRRRPGTHWFLYRCTNLGMTIEPSASEKIHHFTSKDAARAWARGRSSLLGEPYLEYKNPPQPPPPSAKQKAFSEINRLDQCIRSYNLGSSYAPADLSQAVWHAMRSAEKCLSAIADMPDEREHLVLCAESRRAAAIRIFEKWKKQVEGLAPPRPRLSLVTSSSETSTTRRSPPGR